LGYSLDDNRKKKRRTSLISPVENPSLRALAVGGT